MTTHTNLGQCSKEVLNNRLVVLRCSNKAKIVVNGAAYCTIHSPAFQEKKVAEYHKRGETILAGRTARAAAEAEMRRRADCYPELLAACNGTLPAIRWGMTHQPGNLTQWRECEQLLQAAIAKASQERWL